MDGIDLESGDRVFQNQLRLYELLCGTNGQAASGHGRRGMIFVNSMSDLFHENIPESFVRQIFSVMNKTPWHRYQILTKRLEQLSRLDPSLPWSENIWMGVTVEDGRYMGRIEHLRRTRADVPFFFKQWGGVRKKKSGRLLEGRVWNEMPNFG